jgi:hypothetical protein
MPITPLHAGVLAPINHFFPKKVSNVSFIIMTLWMDAGAIMYYVFNVPYEELHGPWTHSLFAALVMASIVSVFRIKSLPWVLGAFLGGTTHVLLDTLVHSEMLPFYPLQANPFYTGDMTAISIALVLPLIWLIVQYVSCGSACLKTKKAAAP